MKSSKKEIKSLQNIKLDTSFYENKKNENSNERSNLRLQKCYFANKFCRQGAYQRLTSPLYFYDYFHPLNYQPDFQEKSDYQEESQTCFQTLSERQNSSSLPMKSKDDSKFSIQKGFLSSREQGQEISYLQNFRTRKFSNKNNSNNLKIKQKKLKKETDYSHENKSKDRDLIQLEAPQITINQQPPFNKVQDTKFNENKLKSIKIQEEQSEGDKNNLKGNANMKEEDTKIIELMKNNKQQHMIKYSIDHLNPYENNAQGLIQQKILFFKQSFSRKLKNQTNYYSKKKISLDSSPPSPFRFKEDSKTINCHSKIMPKRKNIITSNFPSSQPFGTSSITESFKNQNLTTTKDPLIEVLMSKNMIEQQEHKIANFKEGRNKAFSQSTIKVTDKNENESNKIQEIGEIGIPSIHQRYQLCQSNNSRYLSEEAKNNVCIIKLQNQEQYDYKKPNILQCFNHNSSKQDVVNYQHVQSNQEDIIPQQNISNKPEKQEVEEIVSTNSVIKVGKKMIKIINPYKKDLLMKYQKQKQKSFHDSSPIENTSIVTSLNQKKQFLDQFSTSLLSKIISNCSHNHNYQEGDCIQSNKCANDFTMSSFLSEMISQIKE